MKKNHSPEDTKKVAQAYHALYTENRKRMFELAEEIDIQGAKAKEALILCEDKKFVDDEQKISLELVEPEKVVWDIDEIEKKFPVYVSRDVVKKKLDVVNEALFMAVLHRYGVPLDEVLECVTVEKSIDSKALEQYLDLGEITKDMLDGTFEIVKKKSYIDVHDAHRMEANNG